MALGVPNLDQITTQLDSISGSLDNDADLQKVEFNNPTLEQLDSWGLLDSLDTFGNLDSLSSLEVKQGTANVSTTATATANILFAIDVDASVSTTATVSATANKVKSVTSSVSTSASISSDCIRIQSVDSSVPTRAFYTSLEKGLTLSHSFSADANIANSNFTRNQSVVFAFEIVFPQTVDTACTLFEMGGSGNGVTIGFHDTNTFRFGAFRGNNDTLGNDKIILDVNKSNLPLDDQLHALVCEIGVSEKRLRIFVDNELVGESTNTSLNQTFWAGGDAGGYISQLNQASPAYQFIRSPEPNVRWTYGFAGELRHYASQTLDTDFGGFTVIQTVIANVDTSSSISSGLVATLVVSSNIATSASASSGAIKVRTVSGSVSVSASVSASSNVIATVSASVTTSATASSDSIKIKTVSANITTSATILSSVERIQFAESSVSTNATVVGNFGRIRPIASTIVSTGTISASATATLNFETSISCSASISGSATRELAFSGSINTSASISGSAIRIQQAEGAITTSANISALAVQIFGVSGSIDTIGTILATPNFTVNVASTSNSSALISSRIKILGEEWSVIGIGDEIWSEVLAGSEVWSNQTTSNEVWVKQ